MSQLLERVGPELGQDGLERLFAATAEQLDATEAKDWSSFLLKAFLLLAERNGDVEAALASLRDAAACRPAEGRGRG